MSSLQHVRDGCRPHIGVVVVLDDCAHQAQLRGGDRGEVDLDLRETGGCTSYTASIWST